MTRQNLDPYEHHHLLAWAKTDQACLRRQAAEERLARQVGMARRTRRFPQLVCRLWPLGPWPRAIPQDRPAAPSQ